MMRAIWTDEGGVDASLEENEERDDVLVLDAGSGFFFSVDDAESFAAYLRAWALKQREGV
jgi:hypothetical protein